MTCISSSQPATRLASQTLSSAKRARGLLHRVLVTLFPVLVLFGAANVVGTASASDADYCYLPSQGRGVGSVPDECPANTEQDGLLCYPYCEPGYDGVGPVCWEQCPAGLTDIGAACSDIKAKSSYGRGVGTAVNSCKSGYEKRGGLCYPKCKSGYYGVGPVCWQSCPRGYTDDGAFCRRDAHIISANNSQCPWYDVCGLTFARGCSTCPSGYRNDGCTCRRDAHIFAKASYGRGAGEPMVCPSTKEYDAGLCYPKCNSGYVGVGPVCWGSCPNGYTDDGATCRKTHWKSSYGRSAGEIRVCSSDLENDAGLCYSPCESGYYGVGPVCWGECPEDMVPCAAGCAKTAEICSDQIIEQVLAPLEVLGNITLAVLTAGGSTAATAAARASIVGVRTSLSVAAKQSLKESLEAAIRNTPNLVRKLVPSELEVTEALAAQYVSLYADALVDSAELDNHVELSELSALDPTGIAGLVDAFNHPICDPPGSE